MKGRSRLGHLICYMIKNILHKGCAPRAADAARYARARQGRMQLKTCKGGRKKRPIIWCEQRFDNAKSCLEQIALRIVLSCAVCFRYRCYVLIGSTGVICVGEKTEGRERSNTCGEGKRRKLVHNNTHYTRYCSMFERKHTKVCTISLKVFSLVRIPVSSGKKDDPHEKK